MGYMQHKYTRSYFLNEDALGNATAYGASGVEEFRQGTIRLLDRELLEKLSFRQATVLDFGFGRGEAIKYALEHEASRVIGVDFSADACAIAADFLAEHGLSADLHCDDALHFLEEHVGKGGSQRIDIVLMFDFIEHIPRHELSRLLTLLSSILSPTGVVAVNTPVFKVDNDVIGEGLKQKARDSSDEYAETLGMHCNRFSKRSLTAYFSSLGYSALSPHYFVLRNRLLELSCCRHMKQYLASRRGYPLSPSAWRKMEPYEYALSVDEIRRRQLKASREGIRQFAARAARGLWRRMKLLQSGQARPEPLSVEDEPEPVTAEWATVLSGPLRGHELKLLITDDIPWPMEMLQGRYDDYLFHVVEALELGEGAVVWDAGAHIGYHTLVFAGIVGANGKVVAFEPNPHNRERIKEHLDRNPDLAGQVSLVKFALSSADGEASFSFSDDIDGGKSSGSHLSLDLAAEETGIYASFVEETVETRTIDTLVYSDGLPAPDLIKIDVEGAEGMVLAGSRRLLREHGPILLIEIHNVIQMFRVMQELYEAGYALSLVPDAPTGLSRCFIMAAPNSNRAVAERLEKLSRSSGAR